MKNQNKLQKDFEDLRNKHPAMPVFILVRPQMAENIGMAARAMMNCGIYDMRLVLPRELPTDKAALSASSGAEAILKNAQIFDSLEAAVSDLNYLFATTARNRHISKKVLTTQELKKTLRNLNIVHNKVGILFGCERTGLENEELFLADSLLTIPLNSEHTSLNLSQAVLLVGYACLNAISSDDCVQAKTPQNVFATKAEVSSFLEKMDLLLQKKGYYWIEEKHSKMKQNLDNIFLKASLTSQDVRTLHGVLNFLSKEDEKK